MSAPEPASELYPAAGSGAGFAAGAELWLDRLGSVRDIVRQELAYRFLGAHLPASQAFGRPLRVLDAGCGQGTQGLRLAAAGHDVTGLDLDARMLAAFDEAIARCDAPVRDRVRLVLGAVDDAPRLLPPASFDVVICHGVLMYLDDPAPAVAALAGMLRPGAVLSLLARNQAGIALRAGFRGQWGESLAALHGGTSYVNELGVTARADTVAELSSLVAAHGLDLLGWYGIRVLSDTATLDATASHEDLELRLAAEEMAGRTDPYRSVAPLVQLVARAPT